MSASSTAAATLLHPARSISSGTSSVSPPTIADLLLDQDRGGAVGSAYDDPAIQPQRFATEKVAVTLSPLVVHRTGARGLEVGGRLPGSTDLPAPAARLRERRTHPHLGLCYGTSPGASLCRLSPLEREVNAQIC